EGYIEIVRLKRRPDGSPNLIEVRASHLKDYLCARVMALYVSSYRERRAILDDASHITWSSNAIKETNATDRWEAHVTAIHEGGMPYGEKMAVFHEARTDIAPEDAVPSLDSLTT